MRQEEPETEKTKSGEETPLEEIISEDAPSAREFPQFAGRTSEQDRGNLQTPSATTEAENKNVEIYQVQRDLTESEIARVYPTDELATPRTADLTAAAQERQMDRMNRNSLISREFDSTSRMMEDKKYELSLEDKHVKKRKHPWE